MLNSSLPIRNESHQRKDEFDQEMQGWYNKYMSLNASRENIFQDCANTKFWKRGIITLFPIRESSRTDKTKDCLFRKGHDHKHWRLHQAEGSYWGMDQKILIFWVREGRKKRNEIFAQGEISLKSYRHWSPSMLITREKKEFIKHSSETKDKPTQWKWMWLP